MRKVTPPVPSTPESGGGSVGDAAPSPAGRAGGPEPVTVEADDTSATATAAATAATATATAPRARAAGSLYRGGAGMWAWVAHRITGVLIFFFLFTHVLDLALLRVSPESFDRVVDVYKNPLMNLLEVLLVGAVVYHALNGLRIIAVDLWSRGSRYQRQLLWAVAAVWVVVMVPGAFFMLRHAAETLFGNA